MSAPDEPRISPALPRPPERLSISEAANNLRSRLDYVRDNLGIKLEFVAMTAGMSARALRRYQRRRWNPSRETMTLLDDTLAEHLDRWIADFEQRLANDETRVSL
jgi:transcriptional regulator with XRE-family HTH domain